MRFCENDQKNSHSHHAQSPPDATKTSTNGAVLRPQYVLLKSLYEIRGLTLSGTKTHVKGFWS
ncbi:hypothetical protein B9048_005295 [Klebsiella pneumoniae]|nr:hypothetical protein BL138_00015110 [Klebsiella pneumoniae]RNW48877.1 hypothetical protein C5Y36_000175 [Klebsiella pneumoniae subsp. pneumoniae]RNO61906.1 hypothetical protein BL141_00022885 [Klebsiella pneumoniae]RNO63409.1 hypothetical protein BL140_00006425 [Klebsiella pneumoniae]RNP23637.1 hypothetical protein BL153_00006335 [Klebsiella pneumoniae]